MFSFKNNKYNITFKINKRYFTSKKDNKHYAFFNKEWKDSVYSYNKNNLLNSPFNNETIYTFINDYFNIVYTPNIILKSKRMRDYLRKYSTRKILVGKPEIKQTNNKVIFTIYTLNREIFFFKKRLFFLARFFKNNNMFKIENNSIFKLKNETFGFIKDIFKQKNKLHSITNNSIKTPKFKQLTKKTNIKINKTIDPYNFNIKIRNRKIYNLKLNYNDPNVIKEIENKFKNILIRKAIKYDLNIKSIDYENILKSSFLKKKNFFRFIFFYKFIKWALSFFNVKTKITSMKNKRNVIKFFLYLQYKNIIYNYTSTSISTINIILLKFLILKLNKIFFYIKVRNIALLFKNYRYKNYKKFSRKFLKKEILSLKFLSNLYKSNYKYYYYLPNFKSLIKNIYNKKIEFNIIKLKYIHLNSDIFTQAIAIKLRKKINSLSKILKKSMKLVNVPKLNYNNLIENKNLILDNKYKYNQKFYINYTNWKTNIDNILDIIKYKWITGIRVEARGRLSKRFTASRSLFKFKYKGNLKNLEISKNILNVPSIKYIRDEYRPNLQHSFISSKKRIGVFGIKTWINNN